MTFPRIAALLAFSALAASAVPAHAQGFAALVSPPRFELTVKPGERTRQVIEITNASGEPAAYALHTADWTLEPSGAVTFDDALRPGSCRPWVAIESRKIKVSAGGKYRYRFEIAPPANTPAGECRFAILIEGAEQQVKTPGGPTFPIAGRLGVIVYADVGDAAPKLAVTGHKVATVDGQPMPVIAVANTGNAHGRLAGFLSGTDASGQKLEFNTSSLPIMPGETRDIPIVFFKERDKPTPIAYPITISGKLEWGGKSTPFEQTFTK